MKRLKKISLSLAVISALSFSGCGSSDDSTTTPTDTSKKITGTIAGNGYAKNDVERFLNHIITPAYADDLDKPDKIVVMYNGDKSQKEFSINADGSFEIDTSLFDKNDLVILVVNSTSKKVFGHLNLGTTSSAKLDFIDKSKLTSNLAFGSINTENNCSSSATIQGVGSFSSDDVTNLEKVAIADDGLVLAQNKYKNPDYMTRLDADFDMNTTLTNIKDTFSTLANFSKANNFIGVKPVIRTTLQKWIGKDKDKIKLYPPVDINYTTDAYSHRPYNQIASALNGINAKKAKPTASDYNFFDFQHFANYPSGDWKVKDENNQTVATFSYAGAYPFDNNGNIKIPVPTAKLNMNGNKIDSISVNWYIYNGTSFVEASDDIMSSIASQNPDMAKEQGLFIYFQNHTGGKNVANVLSNNWNGTFELFTSPDNDINNRTDKKDLEISSTDDNKTKKFHISYIIGGVKYLFTFSE